MGNEKVNNSINLLERKIKLLLNEFSAVKMDCQSLRAENQHLKDLILKKDEQIIDFQNKYKISKLVDAQRTGEADISEIKNLLNEYIRDIDRCILHLNQG